MPPGCAPIVNRNDGRLDNSFEFKLSPEGNPHAGRWFDFGGQIIRHRNNSREIGHKFLPIASNGYLPPCPFRPRRQPFHPPHYTPTLTLLTPPLPSHPPPL